MNIKTTFLALSLFASTCQATKVTIQVPYTIDIEQVPAIHNRWGTYRTMITGAMMGGSMGIINYATDIICPFNWLLLSVIRSSIIDNIADDARSQGESVNHELLSNTAWISDWVAYILMRRSNDMN